MVCCASSQRPAERSRSQDFVRASAPLRRRRNRASDSQESGTKAIAATRHRSDSLSLRTAPKRLPWSLTPCDRSLRIVRRFHSCCRRHTRLRRCARRLPRPRGWTAPHAKTDTCRRRSPSKPREQSVPPSRRIVTRFPAAAPPPRRRRLSLLDISRALRQRTLQEISRGRTRDTPGASWVSLSHRRDPHRRCDQRGAVPSTGCSCPREGEDHPVRHTRPRGDVQADAQRFTGIGHAHEHFVCAQLAEGRDVRCERESVLFRCREAVRRSAKSRLRPGRREPEALRNDPKRPADLGRNVSCGYASPAFTPSEGEGPRQPFGAQFREGCGPKLNMNPTRRPTA